MKSNLVKAIVLGVLGLTCVIRGVAGLRYDNHDYAGDGFAAPIVRALNAELVRQANNNALQMIAVGALVLVAASSPWEEYRREKRERDDLYRVPEDDGVEA